MSANDPGQPPLTAPGHTSNHPAPSVALAIGAHPDDVEFGCGGTLAKWAAAGTVVHHLVCTDGSKGTWNPDADTAALVRQREEEQRAAAAALGATGTVTFLGHVDGDLVHSREVVDAIALAIRRIKPDVVLSHDPWKRYRLHPDHRNTGLNVCDAIVAARDPHFLRHHMRDHGVTHHRPSALMLWEADEPNHVEDVGAWVDVKLAALERHASQFESTMKATDDAGMEVFRQRMRTRMAELGTPHGLAAAEIFHLMTRL
ncbi:MAG: PIG-L deacetylase family protein [Actinomycetota bacterium]